MLTLFDAARCPFAARVRIVLAEKQVAYESVEIDLSDRPAWLYTKNPAGKVPVLEEDEGLVLPESGVIMEYLDERYPEPPLLPPDAADKALARLAIERFDRELGDPYYAFRRREAGADDRLGRALEALDARLDAAPYLAGAAYGLADIAYVPWLVRMRTLLGVDLAAYERLEAWLERLAQRRAVAEELEVVAAL